MSNTTDDAPVLPFSDAAAFETWLEENVDQRAGVWLKLAKAGSGIPSLTSDEAVDIGLCFGWISGQRKSLDATHYLQKYVPRRPRSRWSLVNVRKVAELTAAGRMRPSGLAEVEAARADGRWEAAYAPQSEFTVPEDLARALADSPAAEQAFERLGRTRQFTVVLDVDTAPNGQDTGVAHRRSRHGPRWPMTTVAPSSWSCTTAAGRSASRQSLVAGST